MSANVINLYPGRQASECVLRPIRIEEWQERLVEASVACLDLRPRGVLEFLGIATAIEAGAIILEFDPTGREAEVVSGSSDEARGCFAELLARAVIPNMAFLDQPYGYLLDHPALAEPAQFLVIPLPTGRQLFAAIVF